MPRRLTRLTAIAAALLATPAFAEEPEVEVDTRDSRAQETPVGELINIPVEVVEINDFIYMAKGLANIYLVTTPAGNVVIDTGFAHQAKRQAEVLKAKSDAKVTHIILPQAQHDDVGGLAYWKGEDTKIVMLRSSAEYMYWRKEIAPFLARRFALLYDWAPQLMDQGRPQFPYEVVEPDIMVEDREGYAFEVGGTRFEVLWLPGAEGKNSAGVWLPHHKILFAGGGFVGPNFPMWPNIGTVRGDRGRSVDRYITSLNRAIELEPELLLPGQDHIVRGREKVMAGLVELRDAVVHVRNAVVAGMNRGEDVYQLMQEISLPPELADLDQSHGRTEWTIRNMVYEYGAWFQYRLTSELYPHRPLDVYPELVEAAGGTAPIVARARKNLAAGELHRAQLLIEVAREAAPRDADVIAAEIEILEALLANARATTNTFSEVGWLQSEITRAKRRRDGP
ncbi:MAG: alkyl sulfatase dimerization domain-containing protein [Myxococcota bacterium]|nr:alkyl sulfatase dimerization domain-containing protein [Myxococcota bacterium]